MKSQKSVQLFVEFPLNANDRDNLPWRDHILQTFQQAVPKFSLEESFPWNNTKHPVDFIRVARPVFVLVAFIYYLPTYLHIVLRYMQQSIVQCNLYISVWSYTWLILRTKLHMTRSSHIRIKYSVPHTWT